MRLVEQSEGAGYLNVRIARRLDGTGVCFRRKENLGVLIHLENLLVYPLVACAVIGRTAAGEHGHCARYGWSDAANSTVPARTWNSPCTTS